MSDSKGGQPGTRSGGFMASIFALASWIIDDETKGGGGGDEPGEKPDPEVKRGKKKE